MPRPFRFRDFKKNHCYFSFSSSQGERHANAKISVRGKEGHSVTESSLCADLAQIIVGFQLSSLPSPSPR